FEIVKQGHFVGSSSSERKRLPQRRRGRKARAEKPTHSLRFLSVLCASAVYFSSGSPTLLPHVRPRHRAPPLAHAQHHLGGDGADRGHCRTLFTHYLGA